MRDTHIINWSLLLSDNLIRWFLIILDNICFLTLYFKFFKHLLVLNKQLGFISLVTSLFHISWMTYRIKLIIEGLYFNILLYWICLPFCSFYSHFFVFNFIIKWLTHSLKWSFFQKSNNIGNQFFIDWSHRSNIIGFNNSLASFSPLTIIICIVYHFQWRFVCHVRWTLETLLFNLRTLMGIIISLNSFCIIVRCLIKYVN